jgi:hypothetical protein
MALKVPLPSPKHGESASRQLAQPHASWRSRSGTRSRMKEWRSRSTKVGKAGARTVDEMIVGADGQAL